jgi:UPF0716 protein FxsA
MAVFALIALFILVPIAELYVIFQVVGPALGAPLTILLLIADSVIGSVLFRSQGRAVWRRFNAALAEGRMPHREVLDGVLVIFGAAFLITPGFLTDVVGVVLLLPLTRPLVRRLVVRAARRRIAFRVARGARIRRDYDVEGTATEYQAPPGRLPR